MRPRLIALIAVAVVMTWACAPQEGLSPTSTTLAPLEASPHSTIGASSSPTPGAYPGCYYVWSRQELPELSRQVNSALQAFDAAMTGSAYAFGEDCVLDDGSRTFLAMETDFRSRIRVDSLRDEERLGGWIADTMQVIESLPSNSVPGAHTGRVEFEFYETNGESLRLTIDIQRYRTESPGIEGARLFRLFYKAP